MTPEEAYNIILVETLEKDDLMSGSFVTQRLGMAERREYAAQFISDPKYAEMARSLAAWDRKVAEAVKTMQG